MKKCCQNHWNLKIWEESSKNFKLLSFAHEVKIGSQNWAIIHEKSVDYETRAGHKVTKKSENTESDDTESDDTESDDTESDDTKSDSAYDYENYEDDYDNYEDIDDSKYYDALDAITTSTTTRKKWYRKLKILITHKSLSLIINYWQLHL